jgi:hypothetical protein
MLKRCKRCNIDKDIDDFHYYSKAKDKRQYHCKQCSSEISREAYKNNDERRKGIRDRGQKALEEAQSFVYSWLKVHPCIDCGEADPVVLEFDHIRDDKTSNIANMIGSKMSIVSIYEEIQKCEVVCANCHRRRTASRGNWFKGRVAQSG